MPSERRVKITGIIKDSGGFNFTGILMVTLLATMIDETTTPHGVLTTKPAAFHVAEGSLSARLNESQTDAIPYKFEFFSVNADGTLGGAVLPSFNAIVNNVPAMDWDDLIPTNVPPDELELSASRTAAYLIETPAYLEILSDAVAGAVGTVVPVTFSRLVSIPQAIAFSPTLNINADNGNIFFVGTAIANFTLNINNGADGQSVEIWITQDATGGRAITLGSNIRVPDGEVLALDATPLKTQVIFLRKKGSNWYVLSKSLEYS